MLLIESTQAWFARSKIWALKGRMLPWMQIGRDSRMITNVYVVIVYLLEEIWFYG